MYLTWLNCDIGWTGQLHVLYPYEDIFVSRQVGEIVLPTTEEELLGFLKGGSLDILLDIVVVSNNNCCPKVYVLRRYDPQ